MLGSHLIATFKVPKGDLLSNENALRSLAVSFCDSANLNRVSEHFHIFSDPRAITYCFILSQSHFIVHTWPEFETLSIDLFTCSPIKNPDQYLDSLSKLTQGTLLSYEIITL